jgi:DNA replication and repair protein RecF
VNQGLDLRVFSGKMRGVVFLSRNGRFQKSETRVLRTLFLQNDSGHFLWNKGIFVVIQTVSLNGFRNYVDFRADFDGGVNVVTGNNAQGKTNLIEAVYLLAAGRSFRARSDKELIGFELDRAEVSLDVTSGGRAQRLDAVLSRGKRRELYANGVKLKTFSEMSGRIAAVLFSPDDLNLVFGGAALRRRLLDNCLCQLRPKYAGYLSELTRLHEHKTRILRDHRDDAAMYDTLDTFDEAFARAGAFVIHYRAAFTSRLAEKASGVYREFVPRGEELTLGYKTVSTVSPDDMRPEEIYNTLLLRQRELRAAELAAGACLTGAHRDDLLVEINGRAARSFASQGQARTAAVSIKLAEREIFSEQLGENPVLLLDDVLSELDEGRQEFLLSRATGGQIFITCCEPDRVLSRASGSVTRIEGGKRVPCTFT